MTALLPGTTALVRLRATEFLRTWRVWVLGAVMIFFAISGPPLAYYMQELIAAALGAAEGMAIQVAAPTVYDANLQWSSNLAQIVTLVVVVFAAGTIGSEVRSGVAALTLVKPAGRAAYVLTHAGVLLAFVAAVALVGAAVSGALTLVLFGEAAWAALLGSTAVWLVLAAVVVAAAVLASARIDGVAGASGVGIGAFFALALLGIVPALARYTPAGLLALPDAVAAGRQPLDGTLWWPVATGVVLAAVLLGVAVLTFRRREL